MTNQAEVLQNLDDDELVQLLQRMIRYKSYSGNEGELANFLAEYMENAGFEVELQEVEPNRYNVIGTYKGTGGGESVMYNGHIDTNPVGLGWTVNPLEGYVDDKFIYGIGVSNMKASDAAFIAAALAFIKGNIKLKGDVIVGLVVGELQGGIGTLHMLESGIRSDWFINGEPTDNSLLTLHAGAFEIQIDVFGKSRHLSKAEEGVNSIEQASKLITRLKDVKFSNATKPEYAGLNRYNIGVIRGGLGEEYYEWRVPQLPDLCSLKVALRFAPSQTREGMINDIQQLLDQMNQEDPNFKAEIKKIHSNKLLMGPFEVDKDEPVVEVVRNAHELVTGEEPRIGDIAPYKFYGTDAAHLQNYGIKGIVYGCGGKYNTMPDERVELEDLKTASRVYALSILNLCNRTK